MIKRLVLATIAALAMLGAAAVPSSAAEDRGDFQLEWHRFHKKNRSVGTWLRKSKAIENVVAEVNERYALPRDVPVVFGDEFEQGPAYFPNVAMDDGSRISFINYPGWFISLEQAAMRKKLRGVKGMGAKRATAYASQFVIAHEMGHALVHQLDLPITGKEEDAVDGFAAYLLTDDPRFGARVPISAAILFDALSRTPNADDYADEHSLSQQRVYQFLCWAYGSDRKRYRHLVGKNGLPKARAVRCRSEYKQLEHSWSRLLQPYENQPAVAGR